MTGLKVPFNDLTRSWITSEQVVEVVTSCVRSGWYVLGPGVRAFEDELAEYLRVPHAIGVASGTDALAIAIQAVGCESGDRVATVSNAGGYTSTAALQVGCTPVWVDVDPHTLLMSPASLEEVLRSSRPRSVVLTHLYGNLVPQRLFDVCRSAGVAVIEDCAQAIGARRGGAAAGTLGDAAAFSFYPTKNLGAMGDGGAVVTGSGRIAAKVRALHQYGWSSKYEVIQPGGRNSRLDEVQAAVLRVGLPTVDALNVRRRRVVKRYAEAVSGSPLRIATGTGLDSSAHLAVVVTPSPDMRSALQEWMTQRGVATAVHYPVPDQHQSGFQGEVCVALSASEKACERVLSLPCFAELSDEEVDHVSTGLREFLEATAF